MVLPICTRWEIWGHYNVKNKPQVASGKERVILRVEMQIEKSNYFSGGKKIFGIVSIQVNVGSFPGIALGAFNMYHGRSFMAFMALGDIRNLLNLRS